MLTINSKVNSGQTLDSECKVGQVELNLKVSAIIPQVIYIVHACKHCLRSIIKFLHPIHNVLWFTEKT